MWVGRRGLRCSWVGVLVEGTAGGRYSRYGKGRLDVQVVAEDAEREDGYGEAVAAVTGVTAEELGYSFVVVFWVCVK